MCTTGSGPLAYGRKVWGMDRKMAAAVAAFCLFPTISCAAHKYQYLVGIGMLSALSAMIYVFLPETALVLLLDASSLFQRHPIWCRLCPAEECYTAGDGGSKRPVVCASSTLPPSVSAAGGIRHEHAVEATEV